MGNSDWLPEMWIVAHTSNVGRASAVGVAILDIGTENILISNLTKICLPITCFSIGKSFLNFAQSTTVSLTTGKDVVDKRDLAQF